MPFFSHHSRLRGQRWMFFLCITLAFLGGEGLFGLPSLHQPSCAIRCCGDDAVSALAVRCPSSRLWCLFPSQSLKIPSPPKNHFGGERAPGEGGCVTQSAPDQPSMHCRCVPAPFLSLVTLPRSRNALPAGRGFPDRRCAGNPLLSAAARRAGRHPVRSPDCMSLLTRMTHPDSHGMTQGPRRCWL